VETAEVTSDSCNGKRQRSGKVVKERLLFDGINVLCNGIPVDKRVENAIHILPYAADPLLFLLDMTAVVAEVTRYRKIFFPGIETSLFHLFSISRLCKDFINHLLDILLGLEAHTLRSNRSFFKKDQGGNPSHPVTGCY